MKEAKDYNPSKDPRLINCKTECGNDKCYARRYGLFAEKTCPYFVEPKPITNYDLLIRKTPEELAEWIGNVTAGGYGMCAPGHYDCTGKDSCAPCWLDWLKQEVET